MKTSKQKLVEERLNQLGCSMAEPAAFSAEFYSPRKRDTPG